MKTIAKYLSLFLILNTAIPTLIAGGETTPPIYGTSFADLCEMGARFKAKAEAEAEEQALKDGKKKRSPSYVSGFFNALAACATGYAAYEFFDQARGNTTLLSRQTSDLYKVYFNKYLNTNDENKDLILKIGRGSASAIFGSLAVVFGSKVVKQLGLIQ